MKIDHKSSFSYDLILVNRVSRVLLQTACSEVQLVRPGTSALSSSSPTQEQARGTRVRNSQVLEDSLDLPHFLGVQK